MSSKKTYTIWDPEDPDDDIEVILEETTPVKIQALSLEGALRIHIEDITPNELEETPRNFIVRDPNDRLHCVWVSCSVDFDTQAL